MQVSVEKTSNLGRRLTIEVPAANIQTEEQNCLKDLSKNLRVEGFRQGKIPSTYITQKYGTKIRQDAVTKVLQETLGLALKEQNMRPANRPNVDELKDTKGENLIYTVSFEVYPEVNLGEFSKVELEKEVAEITAADVDSGIQKLQNQFATWHDVTDRAAQQGDKLVIDFVGLLDGVAFEHGSANDQTIEIGSNTFIPGFEDGLIGATVGGDITIDVTFPVDYNASNLAGKPAQFNIKIKSIQSKLPAPIDEEFAAKINIADKDVNKVREKVMENMQKYLDDLSKTRLREQALEKLYLTYPLEIPSSLLDEETHNLIHEKQGNTHNKDHNLEDHKHDDISSENMEQLRLEAKKRISVSLILSEIIAKNNMKLEEERVLAKIAAMSLMYGGNAELIRKMYYESKELRQSVENMVLTDQAADLVVANATIKEKQSTFYGIVNPKGE